METIGRTSEPRTITITRTATSAAITVTGELTLTRADVGQSLTGTGLAADTTIAAVTSPTTATITPTATTSGTGPALLGGPDTPQSYGFTGWSPKTEAEADSHTLAGLGLPKPEAGHRTRRTPAP